MKTNEVTFIGTAFVCLSILCLLSIPSIANSRDFTNIPKRNIPVLSDSELAAMARQYNEIPITRWVDYDGLKPMSFAEWNARVGPPAPFAVRQIVGAGSQRNGVKICVIVNSGLYDDIAASLDQYILDLTAEGHNVEIHLSSGGTPADMRGFLQDKYAEGMEGCLLIGDFPVPWYETECYPPESFTEFPFDLYYMDLDGTFSDADADGLYDAHSGDVSPEIWVGRLTPSPLHLGGMTEAQLLNNYFAKNHLYRTGNLPVISRGLTYVDDDWVPWSNSWNANHGLSYEDRTFISDPEITVDTDYEARLVDSYESILICVHSNSVMHGFYNNYYNAGVTTNSEIKSIDPVAIFYNLYACSASRYVDDDYIGGWYIFAQTYGLVAIGSTKTGSMLDFSRFYGPFGNCATIGEAFLYWFTIIAINGFTLNELCWHYGMTLLGDPTLRAYALQPLEFNTTALPPAYLEIPYSAEVMVSGGKPPYDFQITAGRLPSGLTLEPTTGVLSGTPTEFGDFSFTVEVSDGCSYTAFSNDQEYSLEIPPACGDLESEGSINIRDIIYLIDYIYNFGPEPSPMNNADVNGDYEVNILDIVYLINFIYKYGPEPDCP